MALKTQGVHDLAFEVLQSKPAPYPEDIIEDVFVAIAGNPRWELRYNELEADLTQNVVNKYLGKWVKQITGMNTVRRVTAKRSPLIQDYTKLSY